jgi:ABC-type Fe3+/spermidine/putrescine transport system ATPase subunit
MTSVRLEQISKRFGTTVALDSVDLSIEPGELFFLLGPSGCGKSTLLRIVAGLLEPTSGKIFFGDRDVTRLGTEKRNAVMCFQSYALWPHMSVRENVRFGLAVRGMSRAEQENRISEVLTLVQMSELAARKPNELSGGQQQRVALARALAVRPECLLLDEPLSNLDAKLRQEMRTQIRHICKSAGFTTIYVTHDQKEALSVADRIAILRSGKLMQVGTPGELYQRPNSSFVAQFVGETNLLAGKVVERDGSTMRVQTPAGNLLAAASNGVADRVIVSIRPEQLQPVRNGAAPASGKNRLTGRAIESSFLGETSEHVVRIGQETLKIISAPPMLNVPPESEVTVEFDPGDVVVLPE